MKRQLTLIAILIGLLMPGSIAFSSAEKDLFLKPDRVHFSTNSFLEGRQIRIYAAADSQSTQDLKGVIRFYDNNDQIQGDQPVSVLAGGDDAVFVDWKPAPGDHSLKIILVPFDAEGDDGNNNIYTRPITVLADTDRDGIPNVSDTDDDGDGVPDSEDAFPLDRTESVDSDGDLLGNNKDLDDDNDGVPDTEDACPLNSLESVDTDRDGVCNNTDLDDDGDGLTDIEEVVKGTDHLKPDTDGDGVNDKEDAFPLDPARSRDYDHDGIADNDDTDADNDGIPKTADVNDTNSGPTITITSNGRRLQHMIFPSEPVQFETTTSVDPDGKVVKTQWEIAGGTAGKIIENPILKTTFAAFGAHDIKVILTDDKGEPRDSTFTVYVIPAFLPWILVIFLFLLFILAIFKVFSYSKRRRSKLSKVYDTLDTILKWLPDPKKK